MNKILIVDDAKAVRDILSKALRLMGFEAAVASNSNEALNLFLTNSFDLVLTDLEMPDLDGWTLANRIKDKSPNTPVVLVTGSEKRAVMKRLKGSCIDSILFKPFTLGDLQKTVQIALDERQRENGKRYH